MIGIWYFLLEGMNLLVLFDRHMSNVYFNGTFNFTNRLSKGIEKNKYLNLLNAMIDKIRATDLGL